MEILKTLLESIPKQYHVGVILLVLVIYYGFPRFQEWRSDNRYFDAATRALTYKKLLFEIESIRSEASLQDVTDPSLQDLETAAAMLRPNKSVLPRGKRFLGGFAGALIAFALVAVYFFRMEPEAKVFHFVLGALLLAVVAGATTLLYRSNRLYKSALFGGGAGIVISNVIGVVTG